MFFGGALNTIIRICLLQAKPQDLPCSLSQLRFTVWVYLVLSVMASRISVPWNMAVAMALVDVLLLSLVVFLVLKVAGMQQRITQVLIALFGCSAVIGLVALPFLLWQHQVSGGIAPMVGPSMILLVIVFWNIAVFGHVLRHTISLPYMLAVFWSITYVILSVLIMSIVRSALTQSASPL